MKAPEIAERQPIAARRFGTGAKVAALLTLAAVLMALALLVASFVPS